MQLEHKVKHVRQAESDYQVEAKRANHMIQSLMRIRTMLDHQPVNTLLTEQDEQTAMHDADDAR